ncbi:MAG: phosphoribosylformylglycinamidine synthase, purS protein [Acidobacteria bacterium]|nr:MAG: phosphoribosylformylglycinamidine synthase, purS protein [Acidobacteriota bacterium]
MKAHVWVMPKRTVLDPQGQTIHHALSGLGYAAVKDVRQGKFFVLNIDGDRRLRRWQCRITQDVPCRQVRVEKLSVR